MRLSWCLTGHGGLVEHVCAMCVVARDFTVARSSVVLIRISCLRIDIQVR
jgi:hypothetical protein